MFGERECKIKIYRSLVYRNNTNNVFESAGSWRDRVTVHIIQSIYMLISHHYHIIFCCDP